MSVADPQRAGTRHGETDVAEGVDHRPRRGDLLADGADDLPLVRGAGDVAVPLPVPGPGVGQRDLSVHLLAALLDVQVRAAVVHPLCRADLHSTDGVDHVDEPGEADLDVVVDADAGVLLDGAHEQSGPPYAKAALIFVVPWPGIATRESRGIDIKRFGPEPVCSSMIVSVRRPGPAARGATAACGVRPAPAVAADQQVGGALAAPPGGRAREWRRPWSMRAPPDQRHHHQEDQPQREPATRYPAVRTRPRAGAAARAGRGRRRHGARRRPGRRTATAATAGRTAAGSGGAVAGGRAALSAADRRAARRPVEGSPRRPSWVPRRGPPRRPWPAGAVEPVEIGLVTAVRVVRRRCRCHGADGIAPTGAP